MACGAEAQGTSTSDDPGLGPLPEGGESLPFSRASPSPPHSGLAELKASRQCPNKWPLFLAEGEGRQALGSRPVCPALTLPPPFAVGLNSWKPGLDTGLFEGLCLLSGDCPVSLASDFWALSLSEGTDRISFSEHVGHG